MKYLKFGIIALAIVIFVMPGVVFGYGENWEQVEISDIYSDTIIVATWNETTGTYTGQTGTGTPYEIIFDNEGGFYEILAGNLDTSAGTSNSFTGQYVLSTPTNGREDGLTAMTEPADSMFANIGGAIDITTILGYAGDLLGQVWPLLALAIGIPLAFYIAKRVKGVITSR